MSRLAEREIKELFKDYLDEVEPPIKILGMEFSASYALKELDPIAYRVALSDWEVSTDCPNGCGLYISDCRCAE